MTLLSSYDFGIDSTKMLDVYNKAITEYESAMLEITVNEATIETVFLKIDSLTNKVNNIVRPLCYLQSVSNNKDIRDTSSQIEEEFNIKLNNLFMNKDLYKKCLDAIDTKNNKKIKFDYEIERVINKMLVNFKNNGVGLDEYKSIEFQKCQTRIDKLQMDYNLNIKDTVKNIIFNKDQLQGMPQDFLDKTLIQNDKYIINVQNISLYSSILEYCSVRSTREACYKLYSSGIEQNYDILIELIEHKNKIAKILQYPSWVDYKTSVQMIKCNDNVVKLLQEIETCMYPLLVKNMDNITKRAIKDNLNTFEQFDVLYYKNLYIKEKYNLNTDEIRKYYPQKIVQQKILDFFSHTFDIKFERVEVDPTKIWSNDDGIYIYNLYNDNTPLGTIYMDLYPRENKYNHFCVDDLINKNETTLPLATITMNLSKPSNGEGYFYHTEIISSFIHELGHAIHHICGQSKYNINSGLSSIEMDFIETPSQMLEQFGRSFSFIKYLAPDMPDETINKLINIDVEFEPFIWYKSVCFAQIDNILHSNRSWTRDQIKQLTDKYMTKSRDGISVPSYANTITTFGHIASNEYSGQYYSYLLSQVVCSNFYSKFKQITGVNEELKQVGINYKNIVLNTGGIKSGLDIIEEYMGCSYNVKQYIDSFN